MLKLKNVSKFYYNKGIIASGFTKVNLELKIGEFVVITGESGSGKSTLLNVISGLDSYEEGEMYIDGSETSHYTEVDFENYRRKYIGNIFQNFNLVNSYTVYQNIELVLLLNGEKKKNIKKKILDIIDTVGLKKFKNTKVSKLSGGQKQRVAIARALAKETPIIVADEPTGNLDSKSASQIMKLLHDISASKLVIIVTHNKEQVEKYATRLISMHDGRIIEDKIVKKIDKKIDIEDKEFKNITFFNKIRLGVRNTFNIIPKFLLIFIVFFFISISLIFEYSSFKKGEASIENAGFNDIFSNSDLSRIVVKKSDKSFITDEDINKLKKINNVDYVITDDILLDTFIFLSNNDDYNSIGGNIGVLSMFNGDVDYGRMALDDNEIVIESSSYEWQLLENYNEVLDKEYYLNMDFSENLNDNLKVKVVGIKKPSKIHKDINTIYVSDKIIESLRFSINEHYSDVKVLFENKYYDSKFFYNEFKILTTNLVPSGSVYISSDYNYLCSYEYCINHDLKVEVSNIYYSDELNLKVGNVYNKWNFSALTGYSDYDANNGAIFINNDDYNKLFNKETYQSSVFVRDIKKIDNVKNKLESMGYKVLAIKDTLVDSTHEASVILQVFSSIVTVILVVALFFISYFVIKLILKSRSIYFTTIRILGSSKRNAKQILDIELFTNSTLAYISFLILIYLTKIKIINIKQINNLLPFISLKEIIIVYLILICMSQLISNRFSRKIFKKSVMKTYREEL